MDERLPVEFRKRLENVYGDSNFTSYRSLSLAADLSESRVHRILSGQFDASKDGPGFFSIIRLCEALGVTPDFLAGVSKFRDVASAQSINAQAFIDEIQYAEKRPTIASLMRLYVRGGQRIEAFQNYMDYFDLYEIPDEDQERVIVRSIGPLSLAALRMADTNTTVLQEAYDSAPPEFQRRILQGHWRAMQHGVTVEPDAIDERMPNKPIHVKIDYVRVAMRLSDLTGKECIAIYCELIPQ